MVFYPPGVALLTQDILQVVSGLLHRLTKNVERIAASFGYRAEITIMPRHVHLSVTDSQGTDVVTAIESVPQTGISFALNTELSRLSWATADSGLSLEECSRQFDDIVRTTGSRHSRTTELDRKSVV